ncbi:MAG: Fur family transcriptional regulator [Anaerolineae bacterium]|jgi:Fe2+ or Zn2+ uptake regulation protein
MSELQELVAQFKNHGYKMTPQRRAIIEVIADCKPVHPTAEQIHDRVSEHMPDISLATVYNTLRELVAIGQIFELSLGLGMRHYELSQGEHAHLVCLKCGAIRDVPGDLGRVATLFHHRNGFRSIRHDVTIYGYCAACDPARR